MCVYRFVVIECVVLDFIKIIFKKSKSKFYKENACINMLLRLNAFDYKSKSDIVGSLKIFLSI